LTKLAKILRIFLCLFGNLLLEVDVDRSILQLVDQIDQTVNLNDNIPSQCSGLQQSTYVATPKTRSST
jgi:hypothetical protein